MHDPHASPDPSGDGVGDERELHFLSEDSKGRVGEEPHAWTCYGRLGGHHSVDLGEGGGASANAGHLLLV